METLEDDSALNIDSLMEYDDDIDSDNEYNIEPIPLYFLANTLIKFGFYKPKIKKKFMVTPCKHTFHTNCLELWLEMKNECPYCRNKIPPLDYDY